MKSFCCLLLLVFTVMAAQAKNDEPLSESFKNDIAGTVFSTVSKKALKDVNVTVYSSKKEKIVATDSKGNYAFDDLKPGTYKVVFEKNGYKRVIKERVVIKGDDDLHLNIEMIEEGDFLFVPGVLNMSAIN